MDEEPTEESTTDEGSVLSPDELDITAEENVVELEEGRFVISPSGETPHVSDVSESTVGSSSKPPDAPAGAEELSDDVVHEWLEDRLASADSEYAFDVTGRFEGEVAQRALFSNDVVTTFENLVVWYANHVGSDTPVEDVLGILLLESNLAVRFPPDSISAFAGAHGLDGSDTIDALFAAAVESGGIRFPPEE